MIAPGPTPEVTALGAGDDGSAPPRDRKDEELAEIIARVSSAFAIGSEEAVQTIVVSFACMHSNIAFPMEVQVRHVAEVLNHVGDAAVLAGLHDAQFWVQRRVSKSARPEAIHGAVVDVDVQVTDVLAEIERAGIPTPTAYFPTLNGYKLVYAFAAAADVSVFEQIALRLTLALEGGDPASWNPSQGQRLPKCLKTTTSGVVAVNFAAQLANPVALAPVVQAVPFPRRLQRQLGAWSPSPADREQIREFLAQVGIPAPDEPGKALYAACPASEEHDSKCCYVNVHEGGAINVTCLGGHGGEGKKHWSERDLLLLAGGEAAAGNASFDLMRDLPVTWAAQQLCKRCAKRRLPPAALSSS
ncbi:hypothetical protein [Sorangium sp. So ce204]|uniref:hypothetical protein n=1 Tax=Sorangium sp. So ce204 TaxID=3133288 RepID=UPI003F5F02B6